MIAPKALRAFHAKVSNFIVKGVNGTTMSAKALQSAKQAHQKNSHNHPDPLHSLGLRKNTGYDAVNGHMSELRPAHSHSDLQRSGEKIVGFSNKGDHITERQVLQAKGDLKLVKKSFSFSRTSRSGLLGQVPKVSSWCTSDIPKRQMCSGPCQTDSVSPCELMPSTSPFPGNSTPLLKLKPTDSAHKALPDFEIAVHKFYAMPVEKRQEILGDLLSVVQNCGMEDHVGVDLKHKHFDLMSHHVLCEEVHAETRTSVMKPVSDSLPMTPFSFMLVDDIWLPHEFVETKCTVAIDGLVKVMDRSDFLEDMANALTKHNMQDVLGFHVLHRHHLGGEHHGVLETPGEKENELLLRPYTKDLYNGQMGKQDNFQVMWTGSKMNEGLICGSHRICHHCGSHCSFHS